MCVYGGGGGTKGVSSNSPFHISPAPSAPQDDPLSALDVHVGEHVFENGIRKMLLKEGRTVILVTHKLQYLKYADKVRSGGTTAANQLISCCWRFHSMPRCDWSLRTLFVSCELYFLRTLSAHTLHRKWPNISRTLGWNIPNYLYRF